MKFLIYTGIISTLFILYYHLSSSTREENGNSGRRNKMPKPVRNTDETEVPIFCLGALYDSCLPSTI